MTEGIALHFIVWQGRVNKHPLPAESEGGQQQDHEDQESVAFMHCGPVLS